MTRRTTWLLLGLLLLSACGSTTTDTTTTSGSGGIEIIDAWVRLPSTVGVSGAMSDMTTDAPATAGTIGGMDMSATTTAGAMDDMDMNTTGAVYMTIRNTGNAPDKLVGAKVASTVASAAELHEDKIDAGSVARMRPIETIDIPANGAVQFKTGTYHVMLIAPSAKLKAGNMVEVTLQFAQAGTKTVQAEVRAR